MTNQKNIKRKDLFTMYYMHLPLYDELPEGWKLDPTCGSPLTGYEYCRNGKSVLFGGKRALVKVKGVEANIPELPTVKEIKEVKTIAEKESLEIPPEYAKSINELARKRMELRLLADIRVDLMVCELEGWDKKEYLKELQKLIGII